MQAFSSGALAKAPVETRKEGRKWGESRGAGSLIILRHNKDGGYNSTNINKQLSSTQNTPALQAKLHAEPDVPI